MKAAKLLSVTTVAKWWCVTPQRVRQWAAAGRILTPAGAPGTLRVGRAWIILQDAVKPAPRPPGRPKFEPW